MTTFSLPKHCGKVQNYTFKVQRRHTFNVQRHTCSMYKSILSPYKIILSKYSKVPKYTSKYKKILSRYKSILSKYRVTFGTLARNSGSRNPVPRTSSVQTSGTEPNPWEPIEHRNLRNLGLATFWTRNNASGPEPYFREPVPETEPGAGSRNQVPSRNRPSSPRTHRNLYCAKTT